MSYIKIEMRKVIINKYLTNINKIALRQKLPKFIEFVLCIRYVL